MVIEINGHSLPTRLTEVYVETHKTMIQIGNYTVEEQPIGSGGMGQVFKGTAPDGRPVAIKEIQPQFAADPEFRTRIEREIRFMQSLNNPNIVKLYDYFEMNNCLFIVMEFIDGLNLEQYVEQKGAIPWREAVNYMIQLLMTMQDVHNHGIVHRDIKPGNIMIRNNGEICLLDFGVAKDVSTPAKEGATVIGTVIGTDGYMSPEQAVGLSIDHRSDIYSLGCVLYFIITGSHAYSAISDFQMKSNILTQEIPRLATKVGGLPPSLQVVLDRAVDKNMNNRHQQCSEFAEQLDCVITGKTVKRTGIDTAEFKIMVGRDQHADIKMDSLRVSREHAEIRFKRFTGGEYYIFTDSSSNGTVINGQKLTRGMSYNIRRGENPRILLAGENSAQLQMRDIERVMHAKYPQAFQVNEPEPPVGPGPASDPGLPAPAPKQETDSETFTGAIKTCFTKYADFSGRASRAEYWWFALFNIIVFGIIAIIGLLTLEENGENNVTFGFNDPEEFETSLTTLIVLGAWWLVTVLPSLAVLIRRLHDVGKGWGLFFCQFIPVANIYFCLYTFFLLCTQGSPLPNKYGNPPGTELVA